MYCIFTLTPNVLWLSLPQAEAYFQDPFVQRMGAIAIVESKISMTTLYMGDFAGSDPGGFGHFVSFSNALLPRINREAAETGGIRRVR